ncbi:hypothetical protein GCM10010412_064880 [Nonomuraea recticatena]|uniref:Uncharacterized protein n=1 Tax=Nonomuraea recticatena TaxID=46178 RepID=A0ABP6F1E4_9ACTN
MWAGPYIGTFLPRLGLSPRALYLVHDRKGLDLKMNGSALLRPSAEPGGRDRERGRRAMREGHAGR